MVLATAAGIVTANTSNPNGSDDSFRRRPHPERTKRPVIGHAATSYTGGTMTRRILIVLALAGATSTALAQGAQQPKLHVNPRWSECSFQLDPSLTQSAWHQFTGEAGVVSYFRPLIDAEPMGKGKFEFALMQWQTNIDDADAAWNDTFVHPDSTHWLFEGSGLSFPGFAARAGVSAKTDVGVYFTKAPGANYGFYGAQLQQNLIRNRETNWSVAGRASFVSMYGPEDLDFSVYGADLLASRTYGVFSARASISPYVGVSTTLSRAHEKTNAVALDDENVWGAQAMVGAAAQFSVARVAAEYSMARVPSFSLKVGIGR